MMLQNLRDNLHDTWHSFFRRRNEQAIETEWLTFEQTMYQEVAPTSPDRTSPPLSLVVEQFARRHRLDAEGIRRVIRARNEVVYPGGRVSDRELHRQLKHLRELRSLAAR